MAESKYNVSVRFSVSNKRALQAIRNIGNQFSNLRGPTTSLGRDFDKLSMRVDAFSKKTIKSLDKIAPKMKAVGDKISGVGKNMSMGLTLPIVAFGVSTVKTIEKFQGAMNEVSAVTRATGKPLADMEAQAMMLGSTTQFSATQAAEAMTFLGMAGLNTEKIMGAMPGVLELAAAGNLTLAEAADIATNVMTSMSQGVVDLAHINDVLALTAASANTNIRQLAEAMGPVAGTADTLGFSVEEVSGLLGKMADVGKRGSLAGTQLRNSMLELARGGDNLSGVFSSLNINIDDFVTEGGKIKNFELLITELTEKGATASQIFRAFGKQGGQAIVALQKTGGEAIGKFVEELEAADGVAGTMMKTMQKGLPGALKDLGSAFEGVQLSIGKAGLAEFTEDTVRWLAELLRSISKTSPNLIFFITTLAGIAAAIGPALFQLGLLIKFFPGVGKGAIKAGKGILKMFILIAKGAWLMAGGVVKAFLFLAKGMIAAVVSGGPVLWTILAIVAAVALLVLGAYYLIKNWDKVVAAGRKMWKKLKNWWKDLGTEWKILILGVLLVVAPFIAIPALIILNWGKIKTFFNDLLVDLKGYFLGIGFVIKEVFLAGLDAVITSIKEAIVWVKELAHEIFGSGLGGSFERLNKEMQKTDGLMKTKLQRTFNQTRIAANKLEKAVFGSGVGSAMQFAPQLIPDIETGQVKINPSALGISAQMIQTVLGTAINRGLSNINSPQNPYAAPRGINPFGAFAMQGGIGSGTLNIIITSPNGMGAKLQRGSQVPSGVNVNLKSKISRGANTD